MCDSVWVVRLFYINKINVVQKQKFCRLYVASHLVSCRPLVTGR